jgi:hypothetical protein
MTAISAGSSGTSPRGLSSSPGSDGTSPRALRVSPGCQGISPRRDGILPGARGIAPGRPAASVRAARALSGNAGFAPRRRGAPAGGRASSPRSFTGGRLPQGIPPSRRGFNLDTGIKCTANDANYADEMGSDAGHPLESGSSNGRRACFSRSRCCMALPGHATNRRLPAAGVSARLLARVAGQALLAAAKVGDLVFLGGPPREVFPVGFPAPILRVAVHQGNGRAVFVPPTG